MRSWAREKLLVNDAWIDRETEEFVDYWRGEGRKKADWIATWRNSLRRALERRSPRSGPARTGGPSPRTVSSPEQDTEAHWFGRYAKGGRS